MEHGGGEAIPALSRFLKIFFFRLVIPSRRIPATKVVRESIIRTSETQQMINDPEINYCYSYRYIIDVIGGKNMNIGKLADIGIPVLLLHGKVDRNVFPQVSEEFFKRIRSRNKSILLFDCDHWFYHCIFYSQDDEKYSECDRQHIVNVIAGWLDKTP
jgi:alpha-beta hydrolase superfamily lysophospholipase